MRLAVMIALWFVGLVSVTAGVLLLFLTPINPVFSVAGVCCFLFAVIINPLAKVRIGFLRTRLRVLIGASIVVVLGIASLSLASRAPIAQAAPNALKLAAKCSPSANSCVAAGLVFDLSKDVPQHFEKAAAYYRIACDHKIADGCRLGMAYMDGQGVARDLKSAQDYFNKALSLDASSDVARQALDRLRSQGLIHG